ncbi:MAG: hypothetical protein GWN00_09520 [Aliifodinibius sp.]|nr:hypothetical protein [Phycisphaerae bacterium]NIT56447.1 hypothetical protein [Fodinibius sp.]NIV16393.1 hypothetical protein [Fodinibius sp.]NIY25030.1 hypothetical protein [Fodinibius sp.]
MNEKKEEKQHENEERRVDEVRGSDVPMGGIHLDNWLKRLREERNGR